MVNLLRWQFEKDLGYRHTIRIPMKMKNNTEIYDMVFATDHPAGLRIMSHLHKKAAEREPRMREEAIAAQTGQDSLFPDLTGPVLRWDHKRQDELSVLMLPDVAAKQIRDGPDERNLFVETLYPDTCHRLVSAADRSGRFASRPGEWVEVRQPRGLRGRSHRHLSRRCRQGQGGCVSCR